MTEKGRQKKVLWHAKVNDNSLQHFQKKEKNSDRDHHATVRNTSVSVSVLYLLIYKNYY